jgi:hypothetical protein
MLVFADLAQLVEQHIRNVKVASSIPAIGTKYSQQPKSPRSPRRRGLFCVWRSHAKINVGTTVSATLTHAKKQIIAFPQCSVCIFFNY